MTYIPPNQTPQKPLRPECPPGEWQYAKWLDEHRPRRNWFLRFTLWGFIKHKWYSQDKEDREAYTFIGGLFWFVFWASSTIFTAKAHIVFIIPWAILLLIGAVAITTIIQNGIKNAWNKYFPEYQEFKQEHKSKNTTEQMSALEELFEPDWEFELREQANEHAKEMMQAQREHHQMMEDIRNEAAKQRFDLLRAKRKSEEHPEEDIDHDR